MASRSEPENPSPNIYIPPEWSEAADCIAYDSVTSPPPIAIVCGAKNCGKSTFSRYLLNILLRRSAAQFPFPLCNRLLSSRIWLVFEVTVDLFVFIFMLGELGHLILWILSTLEVEFGKKFHFFYGFVLNLKFCYVFGCVSSIIALFFLQWCSINFLWFYFYFQV